MAFCLQMLGFSSLAELTVYITCVFLGFSILMPINALMSAPRYMVDYYRYVTGDPHAKPNLPFFWANILTIYNVVSLVTQIIFGPTVLTRFARSLSLRTRFIFAFVCMMSEVLLVAILPPFKPSQNVAIALFIIVTFVAGVGKSYLEAACYVLVGNLPSKFMSAIMFGCGFSGLIASSMQCIVKVSLPDTYESVQTQAHIYFALTLSVMVIAFVLILLFRFNSFAQEHVPEYRALKYLKDDRDSSEFDRQSNELANAENATAADDQVKMTSAEQLLATPVMPVVKIIYKMQISCFFCFFLALFIFPSLVIPIDRTHNWFATIAILCYNCGDAIGRFATSFRCLWVSPKVTLILTFFRFLFIPLILLCVYHVIPGHVAPYIIMFFVGLTNFFGALSMVHGTQLQGLRTEGQKLMAGQLMGISLLGGASFASLIALAVVLVLP